MLQMFRKRTAATEPVLLLVSRDAGTVDSLEFYLNQQKFPPFQVVHVQPDGVLATCRASARPTSSRWSSIRRGARLRRAAEADGGAPAATPVIVISPDVDEAMVRLFLRLRVADWLRKPADPSELVEACRRVDLATERRHRRAGQLRHLHGRHGRRRRHHAGGPHRLLLSERNAKGKSTTCLVDLDFTSGMCAEYLDLKPACSSTRSSRTRSASTTICSASCWRSIRPRCRCCRGAPSSASITTSTRPWWPGCSTSPPPASPMWSSICRAPGSRGPRPCCSAPASSMSSPS
jgi:DNA-binding NarL/FixJ family response regulator